MPRVTITVPGNSPQPYRFQLDSQIVRLGRGSRNDIVIDCGSVSVMHAEMRRVPGGFELVDIESTNGIKLDGERRKVVALENGMSLKLGEVAFDFQLSDDEIRQLEHEQPATEHAAEPAMELPPLPEQDLPAEEPQREPKPAKRSSLKVRQPSANSGAVFWLLVLALGAFCVGMAIRYEKDTGESWLKAVISNMQSATSGTKEAE